MDSPACWVPLCGLRPGFSTGQGKFTSATLVRGVDEYGNFAPDPVPTKDMDPDIVAFADGPLGSLPGGDKARRKAEAIRRARRLAQRRKERENL